MICWRDFKNVFDLAKFGLWSCLLTETVDSLNLMNSHVSHDKVLEINLCWIYNFKKKLGAFVIRYQLKSVAGFGEWRSFFSKLSESSRYLKNVLWVSSKTTKVRANLENASTDCQYNDCSRATGKEITRRKRFCCDKNRKQWQWKLFSSSIIV